MLEPKNVRHVYGPQGPTREEPPSDVARLRIVLLEVIPPVWRRVQVPANLTLRRLHSILQCAMGWPETEEHQFRVAGGLYGKPTDTTGPLRDSRWMRLADLISRGTNSFGYALGTDSAWEHEVRVEGLAAGNADNQKPICLEGERACPPQGCGGPEAYVDQIGGRRPSRRTASRPIAGFAGQEFDPDRFDVDAVNRALAWLR
jgi:Plasmid pRiA4b ORF-3-like protein